MHKDIKEKFDTYPKDVNQLLMQLRTLILTVAKEDGINNIEESLKWGEPAYRAKAGSTIRFDWKSNHPRQIFIFFNCKTILIETIKEVYGDLFSYEGNRAIVLQREEDIPWTELKHCISMALRYHQIKHLPLLGC